MKKLVYILGGLVLLAVIFYGVAFLYLINNPCSETIGPGGEVEYICI